MQKEACILKILEEYRDCLFICQSCTLPNKSCGKCDVEERAIELYNILYNSQEK